MLRTVLRLSVRQYLEKGGPNAARRRPPFRTSSRHTQAARCTRQPGARKEITFTTPSAILAAFRKHCHDPALTLVDLSRKCALPPQLASSTESAHVDSSEYVQWASVANAPTLATALSAVDRVYTDASLHAHPDSLLPPWVLLSVLSKPPSSPFEAFVAYTLTVSYPITDSPQLLPLAILLNAYWLSTLRMYAPLRAMLRRFVHVSDHLQPYHVSLLLRILAQAEPGAEVQSMIKLVLNLAIRNHMDLGVRTYRLVLENRAASSRVADLVNSHMKDRGYHPNLSHTRAFVRIYGRLGRRRTAARYWRSIRLGQYHGPEEKYMNDRKHQAAVLEETLRAYKKPQNVNMYIKYLRKNTARVRQDPELAQSNRLPTLSHPAGIPKKVWMQGLRAAAMDSKTSTSKLLEVFRTGIGHVGAPAKAVWAYFMAINGLMRRHEFAEAASLLKEVWNTKEKWDARKVTMAVETLAMVNRPDVAFRLLLNLVSHEPGQQPLDDEAPHPGNVESEDQHTQPTERDYGVEECDGRVWIPQTYTPRGRSIDNHAINSFMTYLLSSGRPDAVFYIWDTMSLMFRIEPNAVSLTILLKAARLARKCEGPLQVAIADFGLNLGRVFPRARDVSREGEGTGTEQCSLLDRNEAIEGLQKLLQPDVNRSVNGFWRGERAGDVALRVAWQMLVGNWPILGTFSPPMHAVRRNAEKQISSPISDLFRSFTGGLGHDKEQQGLAGVVRPYDESGRTFFRIVPDDAMFCALLDLLAEEDRAAQVPLVLTWMRYLMVKPSRETLATALVYWGEVTLEGPWIERWKGEERSQYVKMLKWMTRWVGRANMPGRDQTQEALKRIMWFRDRATFRTTAREFVNGDWDVEKVR